MGHASSQHRTHSLLHKQQNTACAAVHDSSCSDNMCVTRSARGQHVPAESYVYTLPSDPQHQLAITCMLLPYACVHHREQFSPPLRYSLWIMAEIAIIGSDIQEVIGSAIALLLLSGGAIPLWGGVLLSVAVSFSMLLVERCGIRKLEGLFALLISIMVGSFAVSA